MRGPSPGSGREVLQADLFGLSSLEEQERQMRLMSVVDVIDQLWETTPSFMERKASIAAGR